MGGAEDLGIVKTSQENCCAQIKERSEFLEICLLAGSLKSCVKRPIWGDSFPKSDIVIMSSRLPIYREHL